MLGLILEEGLEADAGTLEASGTTGELGKAV